MSLYFDFNSSVLNDAQKNILDEFLKRDIFEIQKIVAYTDTFGTKRYNDKLALERLNHIKSFLKSTELANLQQEVKGEKYPSKATVSNYKSWRRVDLFYIVKQTLPIENKTPALLEEVIEVKTEDLPIIQKDTVSTQKFADLLEAESGKALSLDVQFYPGTDNKLPSSNKNLIEFYDFLAANPSVNVLIRGHVCCQRDYDLSVLRAKVVYDFLIKKGIDSKRLDYKGYSNSLPVAFPERTEEDMQKNRRVDVVILK